MILTTKEILKKYNYTLKDLMLHYAALSGEIPNKLIEELGITSSNKNYITHRSSFNDFFVYRRGGGLNGYQLRNKGIDYLLKNNSDYAVFTTTDSGNRKGTNNVSKRTRYQRKSWLYHYLDELDIDYLPSQSNSRNFFFCSETLKTLYAKFAKPEDISDCELRFSSVYGTLRLNYDLYNIYVFDDRFDTLLAATEFKAHALIADAFQRDSLETIIIVRDVEAQGRILSEILNAMISTDKKYNRNPYLFFKESKQNGLGNIHILSFNDVGKNQLTLLEHRTEVNAEIRRYLLEYSSLTKTNEYELFKKDDIKCDVWVSGQPCIIIYTLDIYKIKQACDILTTKKEVVVYFVCLEAHIPILQKIFEEKNVGNCVRFIPIST